MGRRIDARFLALILALDLLMTGIGMGVPALNILLGFLVGWLVVRKVRSEGGAHDETAAQAWLYGSILFAFTLVVMAVIWLPQGRGVLDSHADLTNLGIPQILYSPRASLIGWLVLMIIISPFLQLMAVGFSVFVSDVLESRRKRRAE